MSTKTGTTRAIGGTNIKIRVEIKKTRLKRIREALKTKPANDAVIVAITTIMAVYQTEFQAHWATTPSSKKFKWCHACKYPERLPTASGLLEDN
jgi:hypothetical protein